ncbi:unnamed protein product (macronuclear) [Paramecium tetraurelia]|uniref:DUF541 domain-containing protein n=1 Tax=Paramecium tetraurelia TaxID=5888 RepID=A0DVV7_PARTE|nr:uncharacterized protein GSPATT00020827001 [Paramecium tetraurelia]CAK87174.1 unnamed protein product [Paramecium tetraurelia]|eukprot:XP_001454571.1 hypothetical protein (macronuclear) [Paramecium tetraurelia strain d4-2]
MIRILTIAVCITLIFGSFIKDQQIAINNFECSEVEHRRPDVFYVTGTGSLSVEPTIVTVHFAIEIQNQMAEQALNKANSIQATAFKSLQSVDTSNAGVKITTAQFQMFPHSEYEYTNGNPELKFKGYKVIISQKLETSNLKIVGQLIDAAINAGVTTINSVSFDVKPEQKSELKDQILQLAVKDATHKAEIALKSLDMKIHSIKSISIDQQYAPRTSYMNKMAPMAAMDGASAPTEIYAQEQNLSHSITVGFIIVPNDQ